MEQEILLAITTRVLNFVAKLEKEKFNSKRKEKRKSLSFVPTDFTYHSLKKKIISWKGKRHNQPFIIYYQEPGLSRLEFLDGSKQASIRRDTRNTEARDKKSARKGWKINEWNLSMKGGVVLVADIHFP